MTGWMLLGLTLLSMGWLFFAFGAALNFAAWRRARRAAPGERFRGVPLLPGVVGSLAAFFSVGWALKSGARVPWPWLWILLPLFLDVGCLGRFVLALLGLRRRPRD